MLLQEGGENESVLDSFARADEWIGRGVKSIWAMLFKTGLINIDFSTLRQAFQQRGGKTLFGLGEGAGEAAVADAIASLKLCPLLHTPEFSRKADRLLVNIIGGTDLTLPKVNEIMGAITEQFGRDSHIIIGAVIDEACQNRIEVCVLGTSDMGTRGAPARPAAGRAPGRRSVGPLRPRPPRPGSPGPSPRWPNPVPRSGPPRRRRPTRTNSDSGRSRAGDTSRRPTGTSSTDRTWTSRPTCARGSRSPSDPAALRAAGSAQELHGGDLADPEDEHPPDHRRLALGDPGLHTGLELGHLGFELRPELGHFGAHLGEFPSEFGPDLPNGLAKRCFDPVHLGVHPAGVDLVRKVFCLPRLVLCIAQPIASTIARAWGSGSAADVSASKSFSVLIIPV